MITRTIKPPGGAFESRRMEPNTDGARRRTLSAPKLLTSRGFERDDRLRRADALAGPPSTIECAVEG
jgi:hypothetical protein